MRHEWKTPHNKPASVSYSGPNLEIPGVVDIDIQRDPCASERLILGLEILRLAERVRDLEAERAVKAQFAPDVDGLRDMVAALGRDVASLKTQNGALEQENAELKARIKELDDRLTDQTALAGIRKDAYQKARNDAERLRQERAAFKARAIRAEVDLAAAIRTGEELWEERGRLFQENAILQENLTDAFAARDAVRGLKEALERDFAIAVRTGDEQAASIFTLRYLLAVERAKNAALDRDFGALFADHQRMGARLAKIDALLASEEVPEGLWNASDEYPSQTRGRVCIAAWRWFREALGAETTHRPASAESPQRSPAEASPRPTASE